MDAPREAPSRAVHSQPVSAAVFLLYEAINQFSAALSTAAAASARADACRGWTHNACPQVKG